LSGQQVAEKCKFNTAARATTWGVAGLFLWPLLIPAVVDGLGSSNANKSMEQDFQYKELPDKVRVQPNGLQTGIVFVPAMKPGEDIVMRLTNVESGQILLFSSRKP